MAYFEPSALCAINCEPSQPAHAVQVGPAPVPHEMNLDLPVDARRVDGLHAPSPNPAGYAAPGAYLATAGDVSVRHCSNIRCASAAALVFWSGVSMV